jgi:hypothetical protein
VHVDGIADGTLFEGRMKKMGAVIVLGVLSSAATARPPTVGMNPGYDRALQEAREQQRASEARDYQLNIVVKRHKRRK